MSIQLLDVEKKYLKGSTAEVQALRQINISIDRGECIAVVGASGSGKSTLLHILGLLDKPTEGKYLLNQKNTLEMTQRELAKLRNKNIGFVLQDFGLILDQTVYENLSIPLLFGEGSLRSVKTLVEKSLEKNNLQALRNKKINELSGGQKQRVAIARALINDPEIILADEPTGALDSKTSNEVMSLLWESHAMKKTLIIVTHHQDIANQCKRILQIRDGMII